MVERAIPNCSAIVSTGTSRVRSSARIVFKSFGLGFFGLYSAITQSRQRGRQQIFVMQATQHRSDAHAEALADPMAGKW